MSSFRGLGAGLGLLVAVLGTGCFSRYHKANELAQQRRFVEAAELFEQLAKEEPNNVELPSLLQRARHRAVEDALGRARQLRLTENPEGGERAFAEGLVLRERWNVRLNGALEGTVDDERQAFAHRVLSTVRDHTAKGEALTAEARVDEKRFLLAHVELEALRSQLEDQVRVAGHARCAQLKKSQSAERPYWTSLVAHYCRHFQARPPTEHALPDVASKVTLASARVIGSAEGASAVLTAWAEAQVRQSPWYSEAGAQPANVELRGQVRVAQAEASVTLSAEWQEQVPFVVQVTKQLQETVPVVECETYQQRGVNGVEERVREVTRQKTSTREVVVNETRFRWVPRVFSYSALRVEEERFLSLAGALVVGDQVVARAGHEDRSSEVGYHHDVTFTPAEVRPSRPHFTPRPVWEQQQGAAWASRFGESLEAEWKARFCAADAYTEEEGARCARAGRGVPARAVESLRTALGADAALAPGLLLRRPSS